MKTKTDKLKQAVKSTFLAGSLAVSSLAFAGGNDQYTTDEKLRDAWLDGKIETALLINRHLNSFKIDTEVKNNVAYLSGTVDTEVDRALAAEIAQGIEGVTSVDNDIIVKQSPVSTTDKMHMTHEHEPEKTRTFGQWYDDATTTASIKSELLFNENTTGTDVNVDTAYGVVTINGVVKSEQERSLIIEIAENTPGVKKVENEIEVDSNS
ncbi:MAG: BON domain-containing protein [Marinicella sp.]|nr:BON domain-containing protein [Xanthomonadales bacterium]